MIILLLVLLLILTVVCVYCATNFDFGEETFIAGSILFGLGFTISCVVFIIIAITVSSGKTISQRIEMYQEQNQKIEESIADLVENYMNYEANTFKNISSDSAITLVSLYPELKSDTLVEQQCNLYMENNKKITELREEQINMTVYRWWLYFGK